MIASSPDAFPTGPQLPPPGRLSDRPIEQTPPDAWIWQGILAPGQVTLLASQWKSGKTTLLAALLDRMRAGGELAGLAVRPGRALVISEEERQHWDRRRRRFDLESHVQFHWKLFRGRKPDAAHWQALIDQLGWLRREHRLDLAVIDTLGPHLPGRCENNAELLYEALAPFEQLTADGLALLLLHHCRKAAGPDGQAPRGSGALTAFADIHLEMQWYDRAGSLDRRRKLSAYSRFDETPRQLVIELDPAGADFLSHGDFEQDEFHHNLGPLLAALTPARTKLGRGEILAAWPADEAKPSPKTLYLWLERAVEQGLVRRCGEGKAHQPFEYWLPSLEEKWRTDPLARAAQEQRDFQRNGGLEALIEQVNRQQEEARRRR